MEHANLVRSRCEKAEPDRYRRAGLENRPRLRKEDAATLRLFTLDSVAIPANIPAIFW